MKNLRKALAVAVTAAALSTTFATPAQAGRGTFAYYVDGWFGDPSSTIPRTVAATTRCPKRTGRPATPTGLPFCTEVRTATTARSWRFSSRARAVPIASVRSSSWSGETARGVEECPARARPGRASSRHLRYRLLRSAAQDGRTAQGRARCRPRGAGRKRGRGDGDRRVGCARTSRRSRPALPAARGRPI